MQGVDIVRQVDVVRTPRLMQLEGLFDIPPSEKSQEKWRVDAGYFRDELAPHSSTLGQKQARIILRFWHS